MTMRIVLVALLGLQAASGIRDHPVTDTMEGIGNTAGTVQGGVASAGNTVGADKVGEGAGSVVTGAGDAVGSGASSVGGAVGAEPDHVEIIGGGIVPTSIQCVINLTIQYMGIYTAIAIGRTVADFMGANFEHYTVGESLTQATITV